MNAIDLKFGKEHKRELGADTHLPYLRHVDPQTLTLKNGTFLSVIKLSGLAFQTMDQAEINAKLINRNTTVRALATSRFALYGTLIRRRINPEISGTFDNPFAAELNDRYMDRLGDKTLFVNEMYLTVIRRPMLGKVGVVDKLLGGARSKTAGTEAHSEVLRDLHELVAQITGDLRPYGAEVLTTVKRERSIYSEPAEFLAKILAGGDPIDMPLPRMSLAKYIATRRLFFGRKALEIDEGLDRPAKLGAMLSIKEYPPFTVAGQLDGLLRLPHEFIMTQSFAIEDRVTVMEAMKRIGRQTANSDDGGTSVEDDVHAARDKLSSGEVVFGKHHFTVCALGADLRGLNKATMDISAELSRMGVVPVREDLNMEAAFWAQMPGNFSYIARQATISSLNFATLFSAHNFPAGRTSKLHWKRPIALLETTSQTPYNFSFHVDDVGNFTVVGPTGSGKTVAMSFLLAQSLRIEPRPRCVFFDKDRGADIFVRAMGGRYEVLQPGTPTGFAPFQLKDTPENLQFGKDLLMMMLREEDHPLSPEEAEVISDAVGSFYADIPREARKLEQLHEVLKGRLSGQVGDLADRLTEWTAGDKGWLFNNDIDELDFSKSVLGFDMTAVLSDPRTRTASLLYIFHRLRELLDGTPALIFLDEGWRLLDDPVFEMFIKDMLKTIRKQNGVIGFGTQSAADITRSAISATLVEQTQTNIFFPNPKADEASYRTYFGLSEKEFRFVKEADKRSRTFLIRHALDSIVARLDLTGMEDLVKVLSGRSETVRECEALRERHGDDPADWLPHFCGWTDEETT